MLHLYIVPDINKVSGGPRSRITNFKREFISRNYRIIEGSLKEKLKASLAVKKSDNVYVESASNRIHLADIICLLYIYIKTKNIIVFIRDIYVELLSLEYKSFRKRITKSANKFSSWFLTKISYKMVFPTENMGHQFFKLNPKYQKKPYLALPPGCTNTFSSKKITRTKPGICYMGGINYQNCGIENFLILAKSFHSDFNFFILSQDSHVMNLLNEYKLNNIVSFTSVPYSDLDHYFGSNNVMFGFHSRNRSFYDDITFPIKVLDYISLEVPFISDFHEPIVELVGSDYPLFTKVVDYKKIEELISIYSDPNKYHQLVKLLQMIKESNLYSSRLNQLEKMFH